MSIETIKPTTENTTTTNDKEQGSLAVDLLKLAGVAFTIYRAFSSAKNQKQAAALTPSGQGVVRSSDHASMASVDKNALMNMGLQHMRNMTRITTR